MSGSFCYFHHVANIGKSKFNDLDWKQYIQWIHVTVQSWDTVNFVDSGASKNSPEVYSLRSTMKVSKANCDSKQIVFCLLMFEGSIKIPPRLLGCIICFHFTLLFVKFFAQPFLQSRIRNCLFSLPPSSRAHPPMFAVGSDDSNVTYGGKVQIYEYNENTRYVYE